MTNVTKSRVNTNLDKILEDMLKEVTKKTTNPEDKVSLTDKMKVIDRVLKWEAIKAKLNDGDWGAGFNE
jgi:hypothetical protein